MKINMLAYADDMLLLSTSKSGLQKALNILQIYCRKWQLVVNETKTKIVIFNRVDKYSTFTLNDQHIEVVQQHMYLGIKLHSSGNFTCSIKDLADRATKAYYCAKSALSNCQSSPRIQIKIFDSVVKPILTYGSEIWGAFGLKKANKDNLLLKMLTNETVPYEKLIIKKCVNKLYMYLNRHLI